MPRASSAHSSRSTTPADVRIGNLIRAQRRSKGLTQTELGKAVGIASQQIHKYEKGVNRVPSARLAQIAKVIDVSLSDFFEGNTKRKGELESFALMKSAAALRLLRAFNAIKSRSSRYRVLEIVEKMAAK